MAAFIDDQVQPIFPQVLSYGTSGPYDPDPLVTHGPSDTDDRSGCNHASDKTPHRNLTARIGQGRFVCRAHRLRDLAHRRLACPKDACIA
jgi:hypothetical protein